MSSEINDILKKLDVIENKLQENHNMLIELIEKGNKEVHTTYEFLDKKFLENNEATQINRLLIFIGWALFLKDQK